MSFPVFLVPIIAGLIAQSLKPLLNKRWYAVISEEGHKIPRYGGMPSAHTAFATSLATTLGVVDGFASTSFAIGVAALILIIDDALRMRILLGRHGFALRRLVNKLPPLERKEFPYLEARLGHKVPEVIAGGLLGIVLSLLLLWVISLA